MTDVFEGYKRLTLNGNLALMRVSSMGALRLTDEVILDCDGVLIDSGDSYDRAIEMTVAYFLSSVFDLKLNPAFPTKELVESLRRTGQYNNDIDTAAAILVGMAACLSSCRNTKRLQTRGKTPELQEKLDSKAFASRVSSLLEMASRGFNSFVSTVKMEVPDSAQCMDELLESLAYPGGPASSPLSRVFDEYYYGPALLKQLHGLAPVVGCKTGLIDFEKVLVSAETLWSLSSFLSKKRIGIVSGRSRLGTEYSLGELIKFFEDGPKIFLEDHDANINPTQAIRGKPSPESLLLAANRAGTSRTILYVGDSVEDVMMTRNANLVRPSFAFCGVTRAPFSQRRASTLAEHGADAILQSVNDLPALLSNVR